VAAVITVDPLEGFRPSYNATACNAIGGLLRLGILGLLGLMMADSRAGSRPGDSMSTADLMTSNRASRGALAGTGRFFVRIVRSMRTERKPHDYGSQKNPSHQNLPFADCNSTRINRECCG
jgi:hypothetical protein